MKSNQVTISELKQIRVETENSAFLKSEIQIDLNPHCALKKDEEGVLRTFYGFKNKKDMRERTSNNKQLVLILAGTVDSKLDISGKLLEEISEVIEKYIHG